MVAPPRSPAVAATPGKRQELEHTPTKTSTPRRRKLPKGTGSPTDSKIKPSHPKRRSIESMDVDGTDRSASEASPSSRSEAQDDSHVTSASFGNGTRLGTENRARALSQDEKRMMEEEKPALRKVLEEIRDRSKEVEDKVSALVTRAQREAAEDSGPREEGASFLAAKQMLLLSYCRDLCAYAASKGRGEPLSGEGAAGRLVELRTVMEKLRPMDRKLKYQTDKLLRIASAPASNGRDEDDGGEGGDDEDDPLSFRPRPEAMAPWGQDADSTTGSSRDRGGKTPKGSASGEAEDESGLYRAPRMASMPYDEDGVAGGSAAARGEKRLEKRRDKLRRGEVMESLREEFGEQPETVRALGNSGASGVSEAKMKKLLEEDKERLDFEEDHMVRLTVTRKAKRARAQMEKDAGRLETIADVGSAADFVRVAKDSDGFGAEMEGGEDDAFSGGQRKSRGSGGALGRAMGAVGGSMKGGGGGSGGGVRHKKGKKQRRK